MGEHAGTAAGGTSGADAGGAGESGQAGREEGGSAGIGRGGTSSGGTAGSLGGAGEGGGSGGASRACVSPVQRSSNLVGCDGDFVHRPNADACNLSPRELGGAGGQAGAGGTNASAGGCEADADCTERPDGYCVTQFQAPNACVYSCRTDADCGAAELCACDDSWQRPGSLAAVTIGACVPAACHTDQDCPGDRLCIAPLEGVCAQDSVGKPKEFHCQTPSDECSGRGDCAAASGREVDSVSYEFSCWYDSHAGHHVCGSPTGC